MADPNIRDFYGRVYRIKKSHSRGGGFEAPGTLGRGYTLVPRARRSVRLPFVRPILIMVICVTVLKAVILSFIGLPAYTERVNSLRQGDWIARTGAVIMTIDPATRYLSTKVSLWRG